MSATHPHRAAPRLRSGRWLATGILLFLPATLAACAAPPASAPEVASLGADTTAPDAAGGNATGENAAAEELTDEQRADIAREFAACMREHGIDMPDPDLSGGGVGGGRGGGFVLRSGPEGEEGDGESAPDMETMASAQEACEPIMEKMGPLGPGGEMDPEQEAKMREEMLAFSQCMRDHGIDMPDPEFSDNGAVSVQIGPGPDGEGPKIDPQQMEEAQKACQEQLGTEGGMMFAPGAGPQPADGSGPDVVAGVSGGEEK